MASIASSVLEAAHAAARLVGGETFTIEGVGSTVEGVVLSEDNPLDDSGLTEGYDDARTGIEIAILKDDWAGPPVSGLQVELAGRSGKAFAIVAGSITGTVSEWRFMIAESLAD